MIVSFPNTRYRLSHWLDVTALRACVCFVGVFCVSWLCSSGLAQENPATSVPSRSGQQAVSGSALMRAVAQRMATHTTIQTKMRVRAELLGDPLVGSGRYVQWKSSKGILLRLELGIQASKQTTSVKQLSDGRTLWEHLRIGKIERVNRIDLRKVYEAVSQNPPAVAMTSANLAAGGLPRLTHQLNASFDFDSRQVSVASMGEERVPVYVVTGTWRPTVLAETIPGAVNNGEIALDAFPPHLPHEVELVVDRATLFPYRIAFKKWFDEDGIKVSTQVVTTEFFEVLFDREVDPVLFQYKEPTDAHVADRTDSFLNSLGIAKSHPGTVSR